MKIELLTYKLMTLLSFKVREIVTPFTSARICDFVQEEYALMVDVDQNALFELHAAADFLGIQLLPKLTSLAVLLQRVVDGMHPYFMVSFLELHPLMELITGTQHCENISMSNK